MAEDFLTRIKRLQGQQKADEHRAASAKAKKEKRAPTAVAPAKTRSGTVLSIRIDPERITLPKLRFMGEVPVHQHLLQDDPEA